MGFEVAAEAYGRFMGRWSERLAVGFAGLLDPLPGTRALDVGAGPGALTAALVQRLGPARVAAVDPSESFVAALRDRLDVDVRLAPAERLPFDDAGFDLVAAQLAVNFMTDPVAGLAEMARVARPGATVAATVWDLAGGRAPLSTFWRAARDLRPDVVDESDVPGARDGSLSELFVRAGLLDVTQTTLRVQASFTDLDDWWEPYTLGVGPAGEHVARLDADERTALRARCAELLPEPPFVLDAVAWTARGRTRSH